MPRGYYPRPSVADRFWRRVDTTGDCWLWQGSRAKEGYGKFPFSHTQTATTHRVAWFLTFGYWPKQINHRCNIKLCVRPEHLYEGTPSENFWDAVRAGAFRREGYNAKLTDAQVVEIRRRLATDCGPRRSKVPLTHEYGVSLATIYAIAQGRTWTHL